MVIIAPGVGRIPTLICRSCVCWYHESYHVPRANKTVSPTDRGTIAAVARVFRGGDRNFER
jgi:hypothetical protein